MFAYTDKLIGNVVTKLDEFHLRDKTIVIVMGDNGTKEPFIHHLPNGTDYPGGKGCNIDNGLHVPLVFSCPAKIPHGGDNPFRSYDGLIDVTDIYPTICEAVEIEIPHPDRLDGISFWPQVIGETGKPRSSIYTWYNGNKPATDTSTVL
jgi:arylsulfatase A-like enzyme